VSVAVQVTVVTPFGKVEPDDGAHATPTPGQLSIAVAEKLTTAEHCPGVFPVTIGEGHTIVGACISLTVTVNEQLAVLPDISLTMQPTVVTPFGKVEPLGGLQLGIPTPEQLSETIGAP
jgi:hypothetical protein